MKKRTPPYLLASALLCSGCVPGDNNPYMPAGPKQHPVVELPDATTTAVAERAEPRTESSGPIIHKMGEQLSVGYISYVVWRAKWTNQLSNGRFPNATFLLLFVGVRNDDTKPRTIPPFTLIDENGSEYARSVSWLEDEIGTHDALNPRVQTQGTIVFDIPRDRKYKLKVSGGYSHTAGGDLSIADELFEIVITHQ